MTHVTSRLTAKSWGQLWNPTLGSRVWATFTFLQVLFVFPLFILLSMCCACYRSWWNNHYHRIIIIIIVVSTTTTNCLVCRDCSHRATGPYVCMCVHVVTFVLKELWPRPPYSIYLPWCFTLTHCHRSKLTVVGVMNEISPFLAMDAR